MPPHVYHHVAILRHAAAAAPLTGRRIRRIAPPRTARRPPARWRWRQRRLTSSLPAATCLRIYRVAVLIVVKAARQRGCGCGSCTCGCRSCSDTRTSAGGWRRRRSWPNQTTCCRRAPTPTPTACNVGSCCSRCRCRCCCCCCGGCGGHHVSGLPAAASGKEAGVYLKWAN